MIVAKIQVNGAIARTVYKKTIPAGIIGAQVEFEYTDDIWNRIHKTVVFRGSVTKDVVTDENIVTMPPEVAEKPLSVLSVGVYGVDAGGNLAIPTIWADLGFVHDSADPSGDTTTNPEPPVWAQILNIADEAKQIAQSVREDADSGAFDGPQGPPGDAYFASFEVGDDGHLQLIGADQTGNVSFSLNENGNLEVYYA